MDMNLQWSVNLDKCVRKVKSKRANLFLFFLLFISFCVSHLSLPHTHTHIYTQNTHTGVEEWETFFCFMHKKQCSKYDCGIEMKTHEFCIHSILFETIFSLSLTLAHTRAHTHTPTFTHAHAHTLSLAHAPLASSVSTDLRHSTVTVIAFFSFPQNLTKKRFHWKLDFNDQSQDLESPWCLVRGPIL